MKFVKGSGIRMSCNKIAPVGKPTVDWSNQSVRVERIRKGSRKNNQLVVSDRLDNFHEFVEVTGIRTINRTIKTKQGTQHISEVIGNAIVTLNGNKTTVRVKRTGYAYMLTKDGHTPGRWIF